MDLTLWNVFLDETHLGHNVLLPIQLKYDCSKYGFTILFMTEFFAGYIALQFVFKVFL